MVHSTVLFPSISDLAQSTIILFLLTTPSDSMDIWPSQQIKPRFPCGQPTMAWRFHQNTHYFSPLSPIPWPQTVIPAIPSAIMPQNNWKIYSLPIPPRPDVFCHTAVTDYKSMNHCSLPFAIRNARKHISQFCRVWWTSPMTVTKLNLISFTKDHSVSQE